MNRVITIIVLGTFFPAQLYALDFSGFNTDTNIQYFVPRGPDKTPWRDPDKTEKILEEPPKAAVAEKTGINWWLWGGLAVVAGGVAVLASGGSKSGGGGGTATAATTGNGTVSW